MADAVKVEYLYPPNMLDGDWDEKQGNLRVVVRLSCLSDATGETDVIKIKMSDLKTHSGKIPARTAVEWIEYQVNGMTVLLEWDRAPHAEIIRINANGQESSGRINYCKYGGKIDPGGDRTGDILLTSTNATAQDGYEINICLRLKD
jgi:hypothetical protein